MCVCRYGERERQRERETERAKYCGSTNFLPRGPMAMSLKGVFVVTKPFPGKALGYPFPLDDDFMATFESMGCSWDKMA